MTGDEFHDSPLLRVKVKVTPEQNMKAQRGSRVIHLLFL
jgi:hypothetical protein